LTRGTLTRSYEPHGTDKITFTGRIGHSKLSPGDYKATLVATDFGGNSNPATLKFTIVS
jgi:hypothetical protein